ncbi:MAG: dihydroorotate dehydrogenase [Thermoguttaceae bacterium]|nr:dihydroorotate dehydrogenase [Thermoguttaceae bacterium]
MNDISLAVSIGSLKLENPVLVASGTFGYAKDAAGLNSENGAYSLRELGGILPKTITKLPRQGNPAPRTCETTAGLLNAIGLDNDGLDEFIVKKMPYLRSIGTKIIVSIAGRTAEEYAEMAAALSGVEGVDALELNISCPNVAHGTDFGKNPVECEKLVAGVRRATNLPFFTKLTPNVGDITVVAKAAEQGGSDAVSLINTVLGMAIDWRKCQPRLGNVMGGMSGPAIKPIALRMVYQTAKAVQIPIVGIGGIETVDDVMEFLVAGATAVEVGTANFYSPTCTQKIIKALPEAVGYFEVKDIREIIGRMHKI